MLSRLAGAKVRTFSEPTKLFERKFRYSCNLFGKLDKNQQKVPLFLIIYNAREVLFPAVLSVPGKAGTPDFLDGRDDGPVLP